VVALTAGVGSVAHDVHYAVLLLCLLGLAALLVPWPSSSRTVVDEHEQRVAALRAQLAAGDPWSATATTTLPGPAAVPVSAASPVARLWHPLAVVSTVAAAGVHAAVGPEHWREGTLLGLFFAAAALTQVAGAALLALRPSARVVRVGVAGTAALLALWLVSRTTGVPLVPGGPEAVGGWDLACVLGEVVAVVAGLAMLRGATDAWPTTVLPWRQWHGAVRLMTAASVTMFLVMSTSGVGS
jgi:hypothetical protein